MEISIAAKPFIRGSIAIDSMRDNGYKNAAYALSELIDNSIQAKASHVQFICIEKPNIKNVRNVKQIDRIAILDNGKGMTADVLYQALEFGASEHRKDPKGMGKFGMGLPNSSISQCRRVEVWSWTEGCDPLYTYLDIDEIKSGVLENIPAPISRALPTDIIDAVDARIGNSGTLVLWSKLDRIVWKTAASIFKHCELLVGRIYRKFIARGDVRISFVPLFEDPTTQYLQEHDRFDKRDFKPNDPLYLTASSSLKDLPKPYTGIEPFEVFDRQALTVVVDGKPCEVVVLASVIKKTVVDAIRRESNGLPGSTEWGKHMQGNIGVSLMRADRELDLIQDFTGDRFLDRWFGIEVQFNPELDSFFGVSNNKQSAVNFHKLSIDDDAAQAGFFDSDAYRDDLKDNADPLNYMYALSKIVADYRSALFKKVQSLDVGGKKNKISQNNAPAVAQVEERVTSMNAARDREGYGPDPVELPLTSTSLSEWMTSEGVEPEKAQEMSLDILKRHLNFKIDYIENDSTKFFDVTKQYGVTLLQLNTSHPFFSNYFDNASEENKFMLLMALAAWARMENEAVSEKALTHYKFSRNKWGEMLDHYLSEMEDNDHEAAA